MRLGVTQVERVKVIRDEGKGEEEGKVREERKKEGRENKWTRDREEDELARHGGKENL